MKEVKDFPDVLHVHGVTYWKLFWKGFINAFILRPSRLAHDHLYLARHSVCSREQNDQEQTLTEIPEAESPQQSRITPAADVKREPSLEAYSGGEKPMETTTKRFPAIKYHDSGKHYQESTETDLPFTIVDNRGCMLCARQGDDDCMVGIILRCDYLLK